MMDRSVCTSKQRNTSCLSICLNPALVIGFQNSFVIKELPKNEKAARYISSGQPHKISKK